MDPIIRQWARTVAIGQALNATHMSMLTADRRILNVYEKHAEKGLRAFVLRNDRMDMRGWGTNSENKLSEALGVFILRELLARHDPQKEFLANYDNEGESFAKVKEMEYASLQSLYIGRHHVWWKAIDERKRSGVHLIRAANFLGIKWPEKYSGYVIADYRYPNAKELLNLNGFGRKKFHSLLLILAWAALSEEDIPTLESASPTEVMDYAKLSRIERDVLDSRYLETRKTLHQIGTMWSVTRERARQIESKAMEKIRNLQMAAPIRKWLLDQADLIWASLSKDNGESVRSMGDGRKAYRDISGEVELALEICDMTLDEVLRCVGEQVGEIWIRRKSHVTA